MTGLSEAPASTGELLGGRYRLQQRIGSGGMATVHRALDEVLGRSVAVKLFHPGAGDPADVARTVSETRVLASLNHPSLVTLFDANVGSDGQAYLVMEYIEGPTLNERIGDGPVQPSDVTTMALDLSDALQVVHDARIVHRDIKPSNILLRPVMTPGPSFRAKLADFGIAHLTDSTRLTMPGTLIGTAAYLSPEQVRGAEPAAAADVYALGLVLIESLTGRRVFSQTSVPEMLFARLNESPAVPSHLGYGWKSLLSAMTARAAEDRPTALDVTLALRSMGAVPTEPDSTAAITVPEPATIVLSSTIASIPQPTEEADRATEVLQTTEPAVESETRMSRRTRTPDRRRPRRRIALAIVVVLIIAAMAIGVAVFWALAQPDASTPALPDLPEPLATHLDRLMQEVTP